MIIAIQGEIGSFHEEAASEFFAHNYKILSEETFSGVFSSVLNNDADYGVAAIENSLYGSINEVYDLLLANPSVAIIGEVFVRVEQCLIGLKGADLSSIIEVHSHPVALAQCDQYLSQKLPGAKQVVAVDTALSVEHVKQWDDPSKAAIASRRAAKIHGLDIFAAGIESHHENYTRFVVISKTNEDSSGANKTSLVLESLGAKADDDIHAGSLYGALGVFAEQGINLTKVQSRPLIGKAWHYVFYIDCDAAADSEEMVAALSALSAIGASHRVLGSYKSGR